MARSLRALAALSWPALLLGMSACVPMPVHLTPPVSGQVLDARSDAPVPGAVVVLRYDVGRGEVLPDRDLLAHREVVTDAEGRFRVSRAATPGLSAWPMVRTEARVVGVIKEGYACPSPRGVSDGTGQIVLRLEPAEAITERRASCRSVAARPSEAPRYLAAWRSLYPRDGDGGSGQGADERGLERLLDARRVFGPGQNCEGPVVDLAVSPSGERVGVTVVQRDGTRRVEVIGLGGTPKRLAAVEVSEPASIPRPRRLAWLSPLELVLWEPARALDRTLSPSFLGADAGDATAAERIWQGDAPPASPNGASRRRAASSAPLLPVEPADLNDESATRWNGRSFRILLSVDPVSGLTGERLRVDHPSGEHTTVPLPGEPCGPTGQYGRPHMRLSADGSLGLDLRYVEGGCHAVAIELSSGRWRRLDGSREPGVCVDTRRLPLAQLRTAMRGYTRELEDSISAAGGDPTTSYTLRIDEDGGTRVQSRDLLGDPIDLQVAPLPVETPLSRIDVTAVASAGQGPVAPPRERSQPKLEPL